MALPYTKPPVLSVTAPKAPAPVYSPAMTVQAAGLHPAAIAASSAMMPAYTAAKAFTPTVPSIGKLPTYVPSIGKAPVPSAAMTVYAQPTYVPSTGKLLITVPSIGKVSTSGGTTGITPTGGQKSVSPNSYTPPADNYPADAVAQNTFQPFQDTSSWDSQSTNGSASSSGSQSQDSSLATSAATSMGLTTAAAVSTPTTAVVKPSLWQRILAFFGFGQKPTTIHGEPSNQLEAVGQLVRRARNGDQNAMAIIAEVAKQAKLGNKKAAYSAELLQQYIDNNPPGSDQFTMGAESEEIDPAFVKAVSLSHGPLLSNARLDALLDEFDSQDNEAFMYGMAGRIIPQSRANFAGRVIGQARKLQAVRMKISPIAKFDSNVAWELGE